MRWLFLFLIVALGLALGPVLANYKGYILIAIGEHAIEMALASFLLLSFLFFSGVFLIIWLCTKSWRVVSLSGAWWGARGRRQKQQALNRALVAIQSSDLNGAKTQLDKLAADDFSGLPLLLEAQVAVKQNDNETATQKWQQAEDFELTRLAGLLNRIRLAIDNQAYSSALEMLLSLNEREANHPTAVAYYGECLVQLRQWDDLIEKLKTWKKIASDDQLAQWQQKALEGQFQTIASKEGVGALHEHWKKQKRAIKADANWQAAYVRELIALESYSDAAQALLAFQKKGPVPELISLFRQLRLSQFADVVKRLEQWIKQDTTNDVYYSILGEVAYRAEDWQLAEKALSKAIDLNPILSDWLLLAKTKECKQDQAGALACYQQASALMSSSL